MAGLDTVLILFDRVVHEGTSETDCRQSIEGLRRKLHGMMPSDYIRTMAETDEVAALRQQLADIEQRNVVLEASVQALNAQVKPQPVDGFYTLEQFMACLSRRMGRTYGWRTDYVQATKETPGATIAETTMIQQWQTQRRVPVAFYEQIERLTFRKRSGKSSPDWTREEYEFLADNYLRDPRQSNRVLATLCSDHFGREITENGIRGALDRLRKQGRIPERRPGREISNRTE